MSRNYDEEINENFDYCNELSERINLIGEAILKMNERLIKIEAFIDEQNRQSLQKNPTH